MKHGKLIVSLIIVCSFFGIVFAFTQQARYSYLAASPTPMCKTVQDIEWKLIDMSIDKQKAITLAKDSIEFEKGTQRYTVNGTEVREGYSYNVFSCSFPKVLSVNVGFLLNNGTESHVLIIMEDPSLNNVTSIQESSLGTNGFFMK
jgi:hypothetical protein